MIPLAPLRSSSVGFTFLWMNKCTNGHVLTYQRRAQQLSRYSVWEYSTCMFLHQTVSLWRVWVKCLHVSVYQWAEMFFLCKMDADHLESLHQNATSGQIWVSGQVSSIPQLWKQHRWQVSGGIEKWCQRQWMPQLAEVDISLDIDLGRNHVTLY